ncbi:MAG: hypothetical protein WC443_04170 [Desulfobaccales bacterium]
MAKKKQFAGKETKLAKLPLTQALASQAEGAAAPRPSPSPLFSDIRHLPLTWDEVNAGAGDPLAATYLYLVRELADLKAKLQASPEPGSTNPRIFLPARVPRSPWITQVLRQARQSLKDLQDLLAHS